MTSERDGWRRACSSVSCAAVDHVLHEAVVAGELGERVVAQQVGARVADVGQHVGAVVAQRDRGQRGAHPGGVRVALGDEADRLVAPGHGVAAARRRAASPRRELSRWAIASIDPLAGDLARGVAAHPVGHRGDAPADVQRVLVVRAPADVAAGGAFERERLGHRPQGSDDLAACEAFAAARSSAVIA